MKWFSFYKLSELLGFRIEWDLFEYNQPRFIISISFIYTFAFKFKAFKYFFKKQQAKPYSYQDGLMWGISLSYDKEGCHSIYLKLYWHNKYKIFTICQYKFIDCVLVSEPYENEFFYYDYSKNIDVYVDCKLSEYTYKHTLFPFLKLKKLRAEIKDTKGTSISCVIPDKYLHTPSFYIKKRYIKVIGKLYFGLKSSDLNKIIRQQKLKDYI